MKIINIASGSSANCYYVTDSFTGVLIECGVSKFKIIENIKAQWKNVQACLVSHLHADHSKYIKEIYLSGIKIITGIETLKHYNLKCDPVENLKNIEVGTLNIVPFNTEHDSPDSFGYVIASKKTGEQLLFATDTYFIRYRFANLTHLLVECNFDREALSPECDDRHLERVFESHMSLQDLKIFLESNDLSKVEEIYLCHLSDDNLNHAKAKREIQALTGLPVYLCKKNGGFK
jgi:phosphoribosyl 1,2-cyclic phosphodiesterase